MLASLEGELLALAALFAGLAGGPVVNILADMLPREPWRWQLGCCRKCERLVPAWRYVPVLGWLKFRGCCPWCGERLPRRHFWVNLVAPVALLLLVWQVLDDSSRRLPLWMLFALYGLATLVLLLIFVIDLEHHLILDVVTYPSILGLIVLGLVVNHRILFFMIVGAVIAGGLFGLCYLLAYLIYRTDALGLGDVKLAVLIGLLVGWPGVINALFYGCLAGAATGMVLLMTGKADRQTMIPLGTGLSLGVYLAFLLVPLLW